MIMYYTYMLRCEDGSVYTGITTDPARRLEEHRSGRGKAAGYTRSHRAEGFIALWSCRDRSLASILEYRIKTLEKRKKESLAISGSLEILSGSIAINEYTYVSPQMLTKTNNT